MMECYFRLITHYLNTDWIFRMMSKCGNKTSGFYALWGSMTPESMNYKQLKKKHYNLLNLLSLISNYYLVKTRLYYSVIHHIFKYSITTFSKYNTRLHYRRYYNIFILLSLWKYVLSWFRFIQREFITFEIGNKYITKPYSNQPVILLLCFL